MKTIELWELDAKVDGSIFDLRGTNALDLNTKVISFDGWNIELETTVNIFEEEFKTLTMRSHFAQGDYDKTLKEGNFWVFDDMAMDNVKCIEINEELANKLLKAYNEIY